MIKLTVISKQELPVLVKLSYEGDIDLWEKFHVEKYNFDSAVNKELELISQKDERYELNYQRVDFDEIPIGYVVSTGDFVVSFCLRKEYRTEEIKESWWNEMVKQIGNNIKFGVMSNNERAIGFLKKKGMGISWTNPEHKAINEVLLTLN